MPSTNGHGLKRAILYARVSTDEQARSGYSLAQQLEALREYAAQEGNEVLEEVQDPGQSGASLEKPGMDRVRDLVAAGGVSVVLAQDRDRFAREPAYLYLLRREFEEYGTKMCALNGRGDETPEGELTDGILDQLAKFERAKTAERTRRGKLRRAREGKVIPNNCPDFGFSYNTARDNYVVDTAQMQIVGRIFYMVGVEGVGVRGVKRAFEREGLLTPTGKHNWATPFIRACILDDVYKPHTYEEVELLVSAEVASRLDPERPYGIWWYNRERITRRQVAEAGPNGKRYRRRSKRTLKPTSEWIAVPVPDSGIPREWVDRAREAIASNERTSKNGGRFWELSGGILRCASCGWAMRTTTVKSGWAAKSNHYYRCHKPDHRVESCSNRKNHRADNVEPRVWEFVSDLLTDPGRLRAGLEEMIARERNGLRGDPGRDAKLWANKLAEVDRKRARFQDMAAENLIDFDELRVRLATLEETRETAQRELAALEDRRQKLAELERDRDVLIESYAGMVPEALATLSPEERHHVYKLLRLTVDLSADDTLEVSGALDPGATAVSKTETAPASRCT
jgi:site-specific DNA recombinase